MWVLLGSSIVIIRNTIEIVTKLNVKENCCNPLHPMQNVGKGAISDSTGQSSGIGPHNGGVHVVEYSATDILVQDYTILLSEYCINVTATVCLYCAQLMLCPPVLYFATVSLKYCLI